MSFGAPFPGGGPPVISTYQGVAAAAGGTFNFGTPGTDRCILVCCVWQGAPSIASSCTIAGVAATQIRQTSGAVASAMFIARVPAGTSGSVSVGFSAANSWAITSVYSITGLVSLAAASTAITASATFNVKPFSSVVAVAGCYQNLSTPTSVWSGLTTDYAIGGLGFNSGGRATSASLVVPAGNPALPVSISIGPSGGGLAILYAVFSP